MIWSMEPNIAAGLRVANALSRRQGCELSHLTMVSSSQTDQIRATYAHDEW